MGANMLAFCVATRAFGPLAAYPLVTGGCKKAQGRMTSGKSLIYVEKWWVVQGSNL